MVTATTEDLTVLAGRSPARFLAGLVVPLGLASVSYALWWVAVLAGGFAEVVMIFCAALTGLSIWMTPSCQRPPIPL
jgi:hypothetical protein